MLVAILAQGAIPLSRVAKSLPIPMPGFHVEQLVLRVPMSPSALQWWLDQVGGPIPAHVVLYCSSTPRHYVPEWTVDIMTDHLAIVGGSPTSGSGVWRRRYRTGSTSRLSTTGRLSSIERWLDFSEQVFGDYFVAKGYYFGSFDKTVDFYYQHRFLMGSATFEHIKVYGIGNDPSYWYYGERRHVGREEHVEWLRQPMAPRSML